MQKYLLNVTAAGAMLLLAGCQTATGPTFLGQAPSYTPYKTNMTMAQTVKAELMHSEDPVIAQVNVEQHQNSVVLTGYVRKIRQSDVAERIAGQIAGPQNVRNNIIIRP
ncbi:BON domain-containing protein [Legionella fallonii]|uniref:Periplasmic, osmotically inducible protein Y-like protein n=1 Tax=Legionella fallonii LLAP-10 TaxID=1212491 RepID=A0A098G7M9_9GAMM|nr:BON domain-containing protein [Legionella fallonii]CEG58462.1 Periplasmic, osmotically inducible protein Y-like protein [Legionella fallonii LLAP-10]